MTTYIDEIRVMLTKIKRKECLEKYILFPVRFFVKSKQDYNEFFPEFYKSYVLTIAGKSFKTKITRLGKEVRDILNDLGINYLVFLGDENIPWRYRDSDYKPAKAALNYLKDNKIGKKFKGALRVEIGTIPTFIKHLSWLTRTNTVLPYIYFTNPEHNIVGHICQYGNLHLHLLNEEAEISIMSNIVDSKFEFLIDGHCT